MKIVYTIYIIIFFSNTNYEIFFFLSGSGLEKGYDGSEHTNLLSHPGLRGDDTHLLSHPGLRADGTIVSSPLLRTTRIDPELQAR